MKCEICGDTFKPLHKKQKFCSKACRSKNYNSYNQSAARRQQKLNNKANRAKVETYQPKPARIIETDAEQAKIKKAIDTKYGIGHCPGRVIQRGSEEWHEIAASLTPMERIPSRRPMPPLVPSRANYGGMAA